jgi:hypothetical protein
LQAVVFTKRIKSNHTMTMIAVNPLMVKKIILRDFDMDLIPFRCDFISTTGPNGTTAESPLGTA